MQRNEKIRLDKNQNKNWKDKTKQTTEKVQQQNNNEKITKKQYKDKKKNWKYQQQQKKNNSCREKVGNVPPYYNSLNTLTNWHKAGRSLQNQITLKINK